MKKAAESTFRPKHIIWDEQNLAENEKIKAELNAVKILEPKTPYHGPLEEDSDLDADMKPLNLDDDAFLDLDQGQCTSTAPSDAGDEAECDPYGGSSGFSSDLDSTESGNGVDKVLKRKRFEQHRKAHYNMKEAMRRGKELLQSGSEPDEDDEDDAECEEAGSAHKSKIANCRSE